MPSNTPTLGAKVKIDGESEYKEAISNINAANKVLKSEMQLLQAQYQGNTDSMEYMTAKSDILERQLLTQKEKVEELKAALANAAAQTGESSTATMEWQRKLNLAQAEVYNLEAAIEENNEAMQGEDETMVGLGDTVDQLVGKFGIDLPDGLTKALNGMEGFSTGTVAAMAAAAAAVAAVVTVVKELMDLTLEAAADVDEYITNSQITGVPTELLQAWDYAAPLIDVDAETITGAMTKITQAMGDAKDGSDSARAKFEELGVSIYDTSTGQLRSAEEVFYDVIDALGEMENGTERDAASMDLMGKSAQDLNPLIIAGSSALKDYADQAEETGYILDEYQIERLGEVDDTYQELQNTITAFKRQLASDFAPAAKSAMETFQTAVETAGEMLEKSGLVENLATILSCLFDIIGDVVEIVASIPGLDSLLQGLKVTLGAVALLCSTIADAADLIKSLVTLDFSGVTSALGFGYSSGNANHIQTTMMSLNGTLDDYTSFYNSPYYSGYTGNNAGGTDNWRGGLTWVGESGPELVSLPAGSQVMTAQESRNAGGDTFYISINAASVREFNDIVELAQSARVRSRMR